MNNPIIIGYFSDFNYNDFIFLNLYNNTIYVLLSLQKEFQVQMIKELRKTQVMSKQVAVVNCLSKYDNVTNNLSSIFFF